METFYIPEYVYFQDLNRLLATLFDYKDENNRVVCPYIYVVRSLLFRLLWQGSQPTIVQKLGAFNYILVNSELQTLKTGEHRVTAPRKLTEASEDTE
jgi:hypothetical protein